MKNKMRNVILAGFGLGVIMLLLRYIFKLSEQMMWKYYIIISIFLIAAAMVINLIWQIKIIRKLKGLEKILVEENNADKFIEENEKLLQTLKSSYYRKCIKINLSAGYCDKGDYEAAKNTLLSISNTRLMGINKVVYNINLAYVYFKLEEDQKAISILEQYDKEFVRLENHVSLGGSIAVLKVLQLIAKNQTAEAQKLLNASKEKWTDNRTIRDWEYLQSKIN